MLSSRFKIQSLGPFVKDVFIRSLQKRDEVGGATSVRTAAHGPSTLGPVDCISVGSSGARLSSSKTRRGS